MPDWTKNAPWTGLESTRPTEGAAPELTAPVAVHPIGTPNAPPGYAILGVLGRGGMGVVYQARQVDLNRIVALKMILVGGHASTHDIVRFVSEAEAVAKVRHPNVVPVHHAGRHDGLPYLVMEYLPGGSLADQLLTGPLEPGHAAAIGEQTARGIAACHAAGVLHRDLKPANVLLAADGTPVVSDFGLAKHLDSTDGPTGTGAVIGTPSYMAPEQASGLTAAIGPRTDVYGLGAILYAILTGRPPFAAPTMAETFRQVIDADPVPLRTLQPSVPADLETIVLTCLAKDPLRRYESADAVADDLHRWRSGRPILARRAGPFERAGKWVRRNRRVTVATLGVFCVLIAGTGLAAWQAIEATAARGVAQRESIRAREAERFAKEEAERARAAEADARSLAASEKAARETTEVALDFLDDVFATASTLRTNVTVKEAMDVAATEVGKRFAAKPLLEAAVRNVIGKTYVDLGEFAAAQPQYERALALLASAGKADDPDALSIRNNLGYLFVLMGELEKAEPILLAVLAQRTESLGNRHIDTLTSQNNLAGLLRAQGKLDEAEKLYDTVILNRTAVLGPDDPATLTARNNLASIYYDRRQFDAAEQLYVEILARSRTALGDQHPDTLQTMNNLATIYNSKRQFDRAERMYREALAGYRAKFTDDHPDTLRTIHNLAVMLRAVNQNDEAEKLYLQAIAGRRKILGDSHAETLTSINGLGLLYQKTNRQDRAEVLLVEALAGRRTKLGDKHPQTQATVENLAMCYFDQKKYVAAAPLIQEAMTTAAKRPNGAQHATTLRGLLGRALAGAGRPSEAEPHLTAALRDSLTLDPEPASPAVRARLADLGRELVTVLETLGKRQLAAEWRARLGVLFPEVAPLPRSTMR